MSQRCQEVTSTVAATAVLTPCRPSSPSSSSWSQYCAITVSLTPCCVVVAAMSPTPCGIFAVLVLILVVTVVATPPCHLSVLHILPILVVPLIHRDPALSWWCRRHHASLPVLPVLVGDITSWYAVIAVAPSRLRVAVWRIYRVGTDTDCRRPTDVVASRFGVSTLAGEGEREPEGGGRGREPDDRRCVAVWRICRRGRERESERTSERRRSSSSHRVPRCVIGVCAREGEGEGEGEGGRGERGEGERERGRGAEGTRTTTVRIRSVRPSRWVPRCFVVVHRRCVSRRGRGRAPERMVRYVRRETLRRETDEEDSTHVYCGCVNASSASCRDGTPLCQ